MDRAPADVPHRCTESRNVVLELAGTLAWRGHKFLVRPAGGQFGRGDRVGCRDGGQQSRVVGV